jgi:type I restriction-modification system DNA methylase subunit
MIAFTSSDEFFTPPEAMELLRPYLSHDITYFDPCAINGSGIVTWLNNNGFVGMGYNQDWLASFDDMIDYDIIITNPPYSIKDHFIKKIIKLGKPFAMLMPIESLAGKLRTKLWASIDLQLLVPDTRINFLTPDFKQYKRSITFPTIWFCSRFLTKGNLIFSRLKTNFKGGDNKKDYRMFDDET